MNSREWNTLSDDTKALIKRYQSQQPMKLGGLAGELGLIVRSATLEPGISGEIKSDNDAQAGFTIRVNRHESKARQRFTLAHEIAHFLLHRDQIGDGIEDDVLYRALSNTIEAQANRLAADIVMPWHVVKQKLQEYADYSIEEKIQKIADDLGVSTTAMEIRLDQLRH